MAMLGFLKKGKREERMAMEEQEFELDKPPKPPEFDIRGGTEFPSPEAYGIQPETKKTVHADDLGMIPEEQLELPPVEKPFAGQEQQPLEEIPEELPELEEEPALEEQPLTPIDHVEYPPAEPRPRKQRERELSEGESILMQPGPLFVSLSGYNQVLENIDTILQDLNHAEENTVNLNVDRSNEDSLYGKFRNTLEQMERKFAYIDKTLFEEGGV